MKAALKKIVIFITLITGSTFSTYLFAEQSRIYIPTNNGQDNVFKGFLFTYGKTHTFDIQVRNDGKYLNGENGRYVIPESLKNVEIIILGKENGRGEIIKIYKLEKFLRGMETDQFTRIFGNSNMRVGYTFSFICTSLVNRSGATPVIDYEFSLEVSRNSFDNFLSGIAPRIMSK